MLKAFSRVRSSRVKHLGVLAFYLAKKRYLGLFLDPTQACNLKCRMCYFSGESHRRPDRSLLSLDDYKAMADAVFHRVLRLQIGCGAEPTLYPHLPELVRLAKEKGVPNISLTTNGNLLDGGKLDKLIDAGLDELILSVHGLTRSTYEYLMQHAQFDKFLALLDGIRQVKSRHQGFSLRINYTVNEDNVEELALFPKVFEGLKVDVLQVRPVQNLGDSDYKNFNLDKVKQCYDNVFGLLTEYARRHDTLLIVPSKANICAMTGGGENRKRNKVERTYTGLDACLRPPRLPLAARLRLPHRHVREVLQAQRLFEGGHVGRVAVRKVYSQRHVCYKTIELYS